MVTAFERLNQKHSRTFTFQVLTSKKSERRTSVKSSSFRDDSDLDRIKSALEGLKLPAPDHGHADKMHLHFYVCGTPGFDQAVKGLLHDKLGYDEETMGCDFGM